MTLHTLTPTGGPDVTRRNKRGILYITTDPTVIPDSGEADPDGSIRIVFNSVDPPTDSGEKVAHIELKANGVYNDTGFRFASSSVSLGFDLQASAVGGYIETVNNSEIDEHLKALIPHMQFNETGTFGSAHMPILDERQDFDVLPGPATGEILSTTIGQAFSGDPSKVLHSSTHQVGSINSTAPIEVSYYKGTDNTGSLLNRLNLPAGSMVAGEPLVITYDSDFGFENDHEIFFEFISTSNIALKTNAAGNVLTVHNGHTLEELDVVLDELILANDLSITFDNDLHLVIHNRFP